VLASGAECRQRLKGFLLRLLSDWLFLIFHTIYKDVFGLQPPPLDGRGKGWGL
jgi:hypothetical protein